MELTWTDTVFSRITLVLFLCINQSSPNVLKIYGERFWKIRKISTPRCTLGGGPVGHNPGSATTPLFAVGRLVGTTRLCRPQSQVYKIPFPEKIEREVFVAFSIRRRRHHLFFIWRADLESVLGSGEGKSSPSSSSTFFPLQFHEALHRS